MTPATIRGGTDQRPTPTELHTARLVLRQPRLDDVDGYFALELDPEYAVYGSRQSIDRLGIERGLARVIATPWEQRPGLLRDHLLVHGERVDRVYCGILRAEWEALRG